MAAGTKRVSKCAKKFGSAGFLCRPDQAVYCVCKDSQFNKAVERREKESSVALGFMEWVSGIHEDKNHGFSIAPGVVTDNINLLCEGKVQVKIPSLPEFEPWARVVSIGAGDDRGFCWIPQIDDEVL